LIVPSRTRASCERWNRLLPGWVQRGRFRSASPQEIHQDYGIELRKWHDCFHYGYLNETASYLELWDIRGIQSKRKAIRQTFTSWDLVKADRAILLPRWRGSGLSTTIESERKTALCITCITTLRTVMRVRKRRVGGCRVESGRRGYSLVED
jgi:hypothetical protein